MSRYVLGISAHYHDAAAALVEDGRVVAAASEERFSRIKHDSSLPVRATQFCLEHAGITINDVDYVVYYEKPLRKFERLVVWQLLTFPKSWPSFRRSMLTWFTDKLWVRNNLVGMLGVDPKKILFCDHHLSHAASAFFCSPFETAAVLTVDGVGEWATTALFRGSGTRLTPLREVHFPHSIGLVYSAFTAYLGFAVNDGEYKVMGMAGFGEPTFEEEVKRILRGRQDGSFEVDTALLAYHYSSDRSYTPDFEKVFGPARWPGAAFDPEQGEGRRYANIAASVQKVTEDTLVGVANALFDETGLEALCMAGGVALNVVANRVIMQRTKFKRLFVQPAAGDAGGAIGAALWAWHEVMKRNRAVPLSAPDLGREWSAAQISATLRDLRYSYVELAPDELVRCAVDELVRGGVIGWFQGRFEWGPRALGYRSILADPRTNAMARRVNEKVKFREPFRPFAPSTIYEAEGRYFEQQDGLDEVLPWMLAALRVHPAACSVLPATTHVDATARVHRVTTRTNPLYHALLSTFGEATGHPVLLNTSLNLRGQPIVASPLQALATFQESELDALFLGRFRVTKADWH
jgi:carbamoyltransferase